MYVNPAPDYCIVLGYRMWARLQGQFDFTPLSLSVDTGPRGVVSSKSMRCFFQGMKHPSGRGFVNSQWTVWIDNFVRQEWPDKTFRWKAEAEALKN